MIELHWSNRDVHDCKLMIWDQSTNKIANREKKIYQRLDSISRHHVDDMISSRSFIVCFESCIYFSSSVQQSSRANIWRNAHDWLMMTNTRSTSLESDSCFVNDSNKQDSAYSTSWRFEDMIDLLDDWKFEAWNSQKSNAICQSIFEIYFDREGKKCQENNRMTWNFIDDVET